MDTIKFSRLVFSLCLLFFSAPLQAKSAGRIGGDGHIGDMAAVVGLSANDEWATPFFREITGSLDADVGATLRTVKLADPRFSWGAYTHRLFFHWGYGVGPESSTALNNCVCRFSEDPVVRKAVYAILSIRHLERMERIRRAVLEWVDLHEIQTEALARLFYDIHLLGDYAVGTAKSEAALQPLGSLVDDIVESLEVLGSGAACDSLKTRIRSTAETLSGNREKAVEILELLKTGVPKLISVRWDDSRRKLSDGQLPKRTSKCK